MKMGVSESELVKNTAANRAAGSERPNNNYVSGNQEVQENSTVIIFISLPVQDFFAQPELL
jgi:hypothetical protein